MMKEEVKVKLIVLISMHTNGHSSRMNGLLNADRKRQKNATIDAQKSGSNVTGVALNGHIYYFGVVWRAH